MYRHMKQFSCLVHDTSFTDHGITVNGIYCINTIVHHILSCILILAK